MYGIWPRAFSPNSISELKMRMVETSCLPLFENMWNLSKQCSRTDREDVESRKVKMDAEKNINGTKVKSVEDMSRLYSAPDGIFFVREPLFQIFKKMI